MAQQPTDQPTRVQKEKAKYTKLTQDKAYTEIPDVAVYTKTLAIKNGRKVKRGDMITIHYKGTLMNGKTFDSSYKRNQPFKTLIGVGQVIQGWDETLVHFSEGERGRIIIKPNAAYGKRRLPGIPGNSHLIFDVEIVKVETK